MKKNTIMMTEEAKAMAKEQKTIEKALACKSESRLVDALTKNAEAKKPLTDYYVSFNGIFTKFTPKGITDHQAFNADMQEALFALSCHEGMVKLSSLSDLESEVTATNTYKAMDDEERAEVLAPIKDARDAINKALSIIRNACPKYADTKKSWASYTNILTGIPKFTRMLAWLVLPTLGLSVGKGSNKVYAIAFNGQDEMLQTLRLQGRQARAKCNITGKGEPATNCKNAILKFFDGCMDAPYTNEKFIIKVTNVALFDCLNAIFSGRKLNARTGKFRMVETDDYGVIYQVMAAVFGTCFKLDTEDVEEVNSIEQIVL